VVRIMQSIRDIVEYRRGLRAYTTPRGIRCVEVDYFANPEHPENGEWANGQRILYATDRDWRREMERDWSSPAGDPYFPEFSEVGVDKYVVMVRNIIVAPRGKAPIPVYRCYDLGERRPACVWLQYSPLSDRFWAYREFMPHDLGTHYFRDAVRYLSGQIELGDLAYEARPPGTHFVDITGKEALQRQSNAVLPEEKTALDIFGSVGMFFIWVNPRVEARGRMMRRFLKLRADGYPGLLIDPQMGESIEGFSGGWSYAQPTKEQMVSDRVRDDGHLINLFDAWGYGVSAIAPVDEPAPLPTPTIVGYRNDGRTPIMSRPGAMEELDLYENRRNR
jgi:hypothetical protein